MNSAQRTLALLRLMVDVEFHSGEKLARHLGISRASVSNALRGLEDYGLILHSVRGRGYRLSNPPQWLDVIKISSYLGSLSDEFRVDVLDSASSTNSLLLQHAERGAPSGSVLAAEWQSEGRGRLGRAWHAGLGNALTFSLLWRFTGGLSALSGLSLVVGIALIRALRALGVTDAHLKWPNDVVCSGGKLAGILIETRGDLLGPCPVVIGIGFNINIPQQLRAKINQPIMGLADLMPAVPERNKLFAMILRELHKSLSDFAIHGFSALRPEWESYHVMHEQNVCLFQLDGSREVGIARGVTEHGALILESAQGKHIHHVGEISLRTP